MQNEKCLKFSGKQKSTEKAETFVPKAKIFVIFLIDLTKYNWKY